MTTTRGIDHRQTVQPPPPESLPSRPVLLSDAAWPEQRLIQAVCAGDRAAFGTLVTRYLPRALALATRILHQREDAEDVVQDAFLSALKHIDRFDAARPFWPWLARIIVNRGLDQVASRCVRQSDELHDQVPDLRPSPAAAAESADFLDHVRHAMLALPPRRRLVIELFELEGLSVREIAESLDSTPATIRWHLHMGRRQLRGALAHLREAIA